jgi:hypothetical protein
MTLDSVPLTQSLRRTRVHPEGGDGDGSNNGKGGEGEARARSLTAKS